MSYIYSPLKIKEKISKKIPFSWKKALKILGLVILGCFLVVVGVFAWYWRELPNPNTIGQASMVQSTKIYDRTGTHLLYDIHGDEKRTVIPFSQMPDSVKYATISLEDQNFYTNQGIEVTSIIRAGLADLLHMGATQGASTITQQLIKQTVLTSQKTLSRKIKEAILSIELSQRFSKDDILGMYLNEIPYGSNAYGIEAASQTYFGKHASDLTLDEAALLAALPQAPSYYSPYGNNTDALVARQHYCLDQMEKLGYITQDQDNAAKQVKTIAEIKPPSQNISAPHFVMYVKQYLEQKYGDQTVEEGGLKVYTTLDWDMQQAAEQAVKQGAVNNAKYNASNAALVAMDPNTGQILAMVGSKDYFGTPEPAGCTPSVNCQFEGNFNVATAARQPGSSFKPYVYLTAFTKGYTPETLLWDVDTNFSTDNGQTYDPKNYDGKNRGPLQMKNALAESLNVPAVETEYLAGVNNSIDMAHKLGITTLNDPSSYGLSLVLGGGEVTLLDHVNGYASLAAGGVYHQKTAILKVEDANGNTLEQYQDNGGTRVVDEQYVGMLDYILSTNDLRAPTFGANSPLNITDRPVAAKTGTTNDWRDGWTMGYTPNLVAGVWAGNNDNAPLKTGSDGIFVAAPIWRAFMDQALKNEAIEQFPKYEKVDTGIPVLDGEMDQQLQVCKIPDKDNSYCLASPACPNDDVDTKKFPIAHSILYYVNKDNPRSGPPSDPKSDPQFNNWEDAVKNWIDDNNKNYGDKKPPTKDCSAKDFGSYTIRTYISSPSDGDKITAPNFDIRASADGKNQIQTMTINVNGNDVSTANDSSIDYTYAIPDGEQNSDIDIKVTSTDNNGNSDSEEITVHANVKN